MQVTSIEFEFYFILYKVHPGKGDAVVSLLVILLLSVVSSTIAASVHEVYSSQLRQTSTCLLLQNQILPSSQKKIFSKIVAWFWRDCVTRRDYTQYIIGTEFARVPSSFKIFVKAWIKF